MHILSGPNLNYMKIKEISICDRPRERMLASGPQSLSNAELLAILLRTGTKGESAVEQAQRLLSAMDGSLVELAGRPLEQLRGIYGFGGVKLLPVMAAFELGRRFMAEDNGLKKVPVTSAHQVYRMMLPEMKGLKHEECWVIFLNRANYVIGKQKMTTGGLSATVLDVQAVISAALERKASGIILSHNHPSGNPHPGSEDIKQTAALKQAAVAFDISLLDHVVVCDDCFFSFADEVTVPCGDEP